jgi:protein tyrosine phosphatase
LPSPALGRIKCGTDIPTFLATTILVSGSKILDSLVPFFIHLKNQTCFLKLFFNPSKIHRFTFPLDENDYINASYCDGFEIKKKYICTQGPKENTIPHFWQMVWESNSRVIVMTTKLFENEKKKCDLYWPLEGERKIAGAFLLTNVGETVEEEHFTRTTIEIEFECQTRTIFHFAFRKVTSKSPF